VERDVLFHAQLIAQDDLIERDQGILDAAQTFSVTVARRESRGFAFDRDAEDEAPASPSLERGRLSWNTVHETSSDRRPISSA